MVRADPGDSQPRAGRSRRDDLPPEVSRLVRRQRVVIGVAVLAAVLSLAGLVVSTRVKSPAQRAAELGPPPASLLTAAVEQKVLRSTVVLRGTVVPVGTIAVAPGAAAGTSASIVTATPKAAGARLAAGDVIAQVSGRPVFVLPGRLPAYRDMRPGARGADIVQLQRALAGLGYPSPDEAGTYGSGTKQAVRAFYEARGFDARTVEDADGTGSLEAAQSAVTQARRKLAADSAAVAGTTGPARAAAQQQVRYDREDLAAAEAALSRLAARSGAEVPMAEVVFVPALPATVGRLNARVGTALTGSTPLLTINTGGSAVRAMIPSGQQQLVKPGRQVRIEDEVARRSAVGTVTSVGAYTDGVAGDGSDPAPDPTSDAGQPGAVAEPGYPLVVAPRGTLAAGWLGADVRLTVIAASTAGPVLVAPAAAITSAADGTTAVQVLDGDGRQRRVPVTTGAVAGGEVEVRPVTAGALRAGDQVVTGQ